MAILLVGQAELDIVVTSAVSTFATTNDRSSEQVRFFISYESRQMPRTPVRIRVRLFTFGVMTRIQRDGHGASVRDMTKATYPIATMKE